MADYTRFEIYIPTLYVGKEAREAGPSAQGLTPFALNEALLSRFIRSILREYGGVTQANPFAPTPYQGWWLDKGIEKPNVHPQPDIDFLTYLFVLIRPDQSTKALKFFEKWKEQLEENLNQKYILVVYYDVKTIGSYF